MGKSEDLLYDEILNKEELYKAMKIAKQNIPKLYFNVHRKLTKSTNLLDNYKLDRAPILVNQLFLDLSRKYIKITRDRSNEKELFEVIFETLLNILKMLSITCPFISDGLYLKLKENYKLKEESVHLCEWPKADKKKINKKLEEEFESVFLIIEKGLAERDKEKIGLKWPLAKADINFEGDISKDLIKIIGKQLNVKTVKLKKSKEISVKFDTKLTPELEAEGYAREMSRKVQAFRRKLGLQKKDLVETTIITDDKFKKILEFEKKFLKERTNSKTLNIVTTNKERFKNKVDFKIKNQKGEIGVVIKN